MPWLRDEVKFAVARDTCVMKRLGERLCFILELRRNGIFVSMLTGTEFPEFL